MQYASVNGTELEYEILGSGEPLILIHGAILADGFAPLLVDPAFTRHFDEYRVINYHRRGYAGSQPHEDEPITIAQQAADCLELLHYLDIEKAHVAGHSYGGVIAVQGAIDEPEMVHSLALFEPLLPRETPRALEYTGNMVTKGMQLVGEGKMDEAAVEFLKMAAGDQVWEWVDRRLPAGAYEQAMADADFFFQKEMPALLSWPYTTKDDLRKVHLDQPLLSVLGSESDVVWPGFQEIHDFLLSWSPQPEAFALPHATHALQIMNPSDAAVGLTEFLARHPIADT